MGKKQRDPVFILSRKALFEHLGPAILDVEVISTTQRRHEYPHALLQTPLGNLATLASKLRPVKPFSLTKTNLQVWEDGQTPDHIWHTIIKLEKELAAKADLPLLQDLPVKHGKQRANREEWLQKNRVKILSSYLAKGFWGWIHQDPILEDYANWVRKFKWQHVGPLWDPVLLSQDKKERQAKIHRIKARPFLALAELHDIPNIPNKLREWRPINISPQAIQLLVDVWPSISNYVPTAHIGKERVQRLADQVAIPNKDVELTKAAFIYGVRNFSTLFNQHLKAITMGSWKLKQKHRHALSSISFDLRHLVDMAMVMEVGTGEKFNPNWGVRRVKEYVAYGERIQHDIQQKVNEEQARRELASNKINLAMLHSLPSQMEHQGWTLQELEPGDALYAYGREMHHCVGGYSYAIQRGQTRIFHLTKKTIKHNHLGITVELGAQSRGEIRVYQARGLQNREPTSQEDQALQAILTKYKNQPREKK